jgi:predicted amidohydrolase YtcJ
VHVPGRSIASVDFAGVETLQSFQQRVAEFARSHPNLPWITGRGWMYSVFPNMQVDKKYVDALVADRPVYLIERDSHMGVANTKALQLAGVTRDTPDPPNGHIVHNAQGELTGELKEAAQRLITDHIPQRTAEDVYQSFVLHMSEAAAVGLTAVQQAIWNPEEHPAYLRALAAGELKLRFRFAPVILPNEHHGINTGTYPRDHVLHRPLTVQDLAYYKELRATFRGPLLRFSGIKAVLDGTIDAKTAAMFEPYVGGGQGIPFWQQDELNQTVALYDKEGFQLLLHGIGDKAVNMALNAVEYAQRVNGTTGRRHRIEHAEVPLLSDIPRFKKLGLIASTQPPFVSPDATFLGNFASLLGPLRAAHAEPFKLFDDAGVVQAFGSDWVVYDFDPLKGIYSAVTRMTPKGIPAGGWYPQNRISVEAALRHYTVDGAYANFEEGDRGTLAPGKLADFVELSKDILTLPSTEILNTKVLRTVMGGKETYRNDELM